MKRKLASGLMALAMAGCLMIPVSAMYGSVIADSTIDCRFYTQSGTIDGSGSAEEVIADKDDVMNIYARTVISDPDDYILAEDDVTKHYVRQAYADCSVEIDTSDLKYGEYSVSTFAATRYADDTTDNDMDVASEEILEEARAAADTEVLEGYVHIPLAALGHDAPKTRSAVPRDILLDIYGSHFINAGVGDKVPQIYVKADGSGCCVIDENKDTGVAKTFYEIDGGTFTKIA